MSEAPVQADVGALFAAFMFLLGVFGALQPRPSVVEEPDFALTGWVPNMARLNPLLKKERALLASNPESEAEKSAKNAYLAFGTLEASVASNSPKYLEETRTLTKHMLEYYYTHGDPAYRAMGIRLADTFELAATAVLTAARRVNQPVIRWMKAHAEHPDVVKLKAHSGDFMEYAVNWGLITDDNRIAGGEAVLLRLHFKLRWLRLLNSINDYTLLMHPEELKAIWRWRIEGDKALPMKHRVEVVRWLRDIEPNYPGFEVLGALYAQRGNYGDAISMYREALIDSPFDTRLRMNLNYLLHVARQRSGLRPAGT